MSSLAASFVSAAVATSRALGPPLALTDALLRPRKTLGVARALRELGYPPARMLCRIWSARAGRELLSALARGPLAPALRSRIRIQGTLSLLVRPCVLVLYHSDWWRVVAPLLDLRPSVGVLAGGRWGGRLTGATVWGPGTGLRRLVGHMEEGGSCLLTLDHLRSRRPGSVQARLLGRTVHIPTTAARLAARARVPLAPVTVHRDARGLRATVGPGLPPGPDPAEVTRQAFAVLARGIQEDPAGWAQAHRFLRGGGASPDPGVERVGRGRRSAPVRAMVPGVPPPP